jgi:CheY-like chemotaxis protein
MIEPKKQTALVVDDDATGRAFLRALLRRAGYHVEVATSGEEALQMFTPGAFEVVFMDIRMPGLDGIETTRRLKATAGEVFTPVIFVTGAGDEQSLVRAIQAGGDDFLAKPVTADVLLAKLGAMERIRVVHERTRSLYQRVMEDQHLALEVFDRSVAARSFASPAVKSRIIPAEVFSGDVVLTARSPLGRLHVLVGDFTGHGLAAALGAMPLADTFRVAVGEELALPAILERLNRNAADALPRGHFLALAMIVIDNLAGMVSLANCSLPPILLCGSSGVRARFESTSFPLGIVDDANFEDVPRVLSFEARDRVVVATDGASEAVNPAGEAFGEARFELLLADLCQGDDSAPDVIGAALDQFRGGTPFADDVTVVEVACAEAGVTPAAIRTPHIELEEAA